MGRPHLHRQQGTVLASLCLTSPSASKNSDLQDAKNDTLFLQDSVHGCQCSEIQGLYSAWRKHQRWSRTAGTREELGDEICQKTGLFQHYKRPSPDSASAAFLILYRCPSTDEQMGLMGHLMESGVEKGENSMRIMSRVLRIW